MKKRTRRVLFWLAVVIFAAASGVVVLTAQGYKYDFARNMFVRTGAIAVTANVDANLYVNDQKADPMSLFTHRAGVSRLLPGYYSVRISRANYSTWHKTAVVQEGLLTDFPSVLLLPTDRASSASVRAEITLAFTPTHTNGFTLHGKTLSQNAGNQQVVIATNVMGFQLTDDSSRILWWTPNELWVLWLTSTDYQPFRTTGEKHLITRFAAPISRAAWFSDRDHIVADLGINGYRIIETDTRGGINIIRI